MRTKKLNKTETWELVVNAINNAVAETDTLKKGAEDKFTTQLLEQLSFLKAKQGGGSSTKINEAGEVWCNYFEKYLPSTEFNIKLSKPNKETGERHDVYKANSKDAEIIIRKVKTLVTAATNQVLANFKDGTIGATEMAEILERVDDVKKSKYDSIKEVPTLSDIIVIFETK